MPDYHDYDKNIQIHHVLFLFGVIPGVDSYFRYFGAIQFNLIFAKVTSNQLWQLCQCNQVHSQAVTNKSEALQDFIKPVSSNAFCKIEKAKLSIG